MAEASDFTVFKTVFFYSILILSLPVASFFISKVFFDGLIGASIVTSNVWSAVIAVIVLHIFLGVFIYRAYAVPSKAGLEKKDDKVD